MNTNGFQLPVYIAKGVYTAGHVADIGPLQLAIFDKKTNSVATASGNGTEFYLAGGSPHTKDKLSKWVEGMLDAKKTYFFRGQDIMGFEKSYPSRPQAESWVIGYDGSKGSQTLQYERNKTYKLKIRLFGDPVYRFYGKALEKVIPLYTGCPTPEDECITDCTKEYLGVKTQTREWVKAINNNLEIQELKVKAFPIFSDYAATASTMYKYTVRVVDDGSVSALQTVQRQYPSANKIERVSYTRGVSLYTTGPLSALPAAFAPRTYLYPADCETCLGSDTLIPGVDTWVVRRQLSSSTDVDDNTVRAAYAAQVVTDYGGVAGSGVYLGFLNGEAAVKFNKTAGGTVTALNSDKVEQIASTISMCQPATPATIAWVQGEGGYVTTRTMTMTVSNEDCKDEITLADVKAHLANTKSIDPDDVTEITDTVGTGIDRDNCTKVFQLVQTSNYMHDEYCMSPDNTDFEDVPNFRDGIWKETTADEAYDATIKAGIRITAPLLSTTFGIDSYDVTDHYDVKPVYMELAIFMDEEAINPCTFNTIAEPRRVRAPHYAKLTGHEVLQTYIQKNSAYFPHERWSADNRMREVVDINILSQVKRDAYYVAYYFKFKELRGKNNLDQKPEVWESIIYVDEADKATQDALENAIHAVTGKFGVYLKERGY